MVRKSIKDKLYKRAGGRCECTMSVCKHHVGRCNKSLVPGYWDAHHKTSVRSGGEDSLSNLVAMCATCHKNTRTYGKHY